MSNFNNSNAGTPRSGRFQVRIDGKSYYVASSEEIGQTGKARMWLEKRESSQQAKAQPFTIMLDDLSQGAGFSYAYDKLPQAYAWSAGFDAWAPGIISTRASLTTGASFTTSDVRGWQFQLGNYLYCCRGREVTKYAIAQGTSSWSIVERHDVDGTTPTGKVVTGRPEVFKGKAYIPIRTGVSGSLTVFQELTTQVTTTVEQQTITITSATGGTFTVTFDGKTTAAVTPGAAPATTTFAAATLQAALRLVPGLEGVTVSATGTSPNWVYTVVMTGVGGALGTASPPQMTSSSSLTGGGAGIAHATTVAGLTDTWTAAAANCTAASFRVYGNSLAKAQGSTATTDVNRVYFCTADPMVFANWAPSAATGYEFGEYGSAITDMVEYTPYLGVGKTNGLFTLDDSFQSHNAIKDFERFADQANCIGMEVAQGEVAIPFKSGLIVWDGSSYDVVGLGQEGFFNAAVDRGEGRFYSIAPAGDISYYVANDSYGGYAILGSFRNPETRRFSYGGASRAKVWQTHEIESGARYESVILLSAPNEPSAAHTPSIISDDSAVGTITWGTTSNVTALDGAYATAAAGTSHYLKALSPQPNVPTGATVTGVTVEVAKKAGGSSTFNPDINGCLQSGPSAVWATVQAGSGVTSIGAPYQVGSLYLGGSYFEQQTPLSFDTSSIPDTATVLSGVLTVVSGGTGAGVTTQTVQALLYDFGSSLTAGDWLAETAGFAGKTVLATAPASSFVTAGASVAFTDVALAANVSKTGSTRFVVVTDKQVAGTAPTADERVYITSAPVVT